MKKIFGIIVFLFCFVPSVFAQDMLTLSLDKVFYDMPVVRIKVSNIPYADNIILFNNGRAMQKLRCSKEEMTFDTGIDDELNTLTVKAYSADDQLIGESSPLVINSLDFVPKLSDLYIKEKEVVPNNINIDKKAMIDRLYVYVDGNKIFTHNPSQKKNFSIPVKLLPASITKADIVMENMWGKGEYPVDLFVEKKLPADTFILVDKSNFELHYIKNKIINKSYPIAIGTPATPTRPGFNVIGLKEKMSNPDTGWGVLRLRFYAAGDKKFIHWSGYAIHGTNNPSSIGKEASHGCVRMFNEDVTELASQVELGTLVLIRD